MAAFIESSAAKGSSFSFTLAHSVTLSLGAPGIVTIPDRIIEPLIAATIDWVALEP